MMARPNETIRFMSPPRILDGLPKGDKLQLAAAIPEEAEHTEAISRKAHREQRQAPLCDKARSARRWAALRAAWIERRAVHKCRSIPRGTCETARLSIHVPAVGRRPTAGRGTLALCELCVKSSPRSLLAPRSKQTTSHSCGKWELLGVVP